MALVFRIRWIGIQRPGEGQGNGKIEWIFHAKSGSVVFPRSDVEPPNSHRSHMRLLQSQAPCPVQPTLPGGSASLRRRLLFHPRNGSFQKSRTSERSPVFAFSRPWVAKQHGHSILTMLAAYTAWVRSAAPVDWAAIRRSLRNRPQPIRVTIRSTRSRSPENDQERWSDLAADLAVPPRPGCHSSLETSKRTGGADGTRS